MIEPKAIEVVFSWARGHLMNVVDLPFISAARMGREILERTD